MKIYVATYFENNITHVETVGAATMGEASEIIKALHPTVTYISIENARFYYAKIKRTTSDAVGDLLDFINGDNGDYIDERDNTYFTIGDFALHENATVDVMPALWIEDEDGNLLEYFIYKSPFDMVHATY